MKTLMRNGRDRRSENPFLGHAKKERVSLFGTDQRITSGPAAKRPHSKAEYMTAPGLVTSLARPGANLTGLSNMGAETGGKCVELLRDIIPPLRRVAVLANPVDPFTKSFVEQVQLAGRTAGIEIGPVAMVRGIDEVEAAFAAMTAERAGAVVVPAIFFPKTVVDMAIKHRLPAASIVRAFADDGGLMT
jgi:putative tryptophan/tyrosine transport system substrate-binding protein